MDVWRKDLVQMEFARPSSKVLQTEVLTSLKYRLGEVLFSWCKHELTGCSKCQLR